MEFGTLVLSRKKGESIQIGPDIRLEVVECRSGKVRLAFNAPKDTRILRTELLRRVEAKTDQEPDASPAGE